MKKVLKWLDVNFVDYYTGYPASFTFSGLFLGRRNFPFYVCMAYVF